MSARDSASSSAADEVGKPTVDASNAPSKPPSTGVLRLGLRLVRHHPWKTGWGVFLFALAIVGLRADILTFDAARANEPERTLAIDAKAYSGDPWTRVEPDHGPLTLRQNVLHDPSSDYVASLRVRPGPPGREYHVLAFVEQEVDGVSRIGPYLLDPDGLAKMRTEHATDEAPGDWLFGVRQTPSITLLVLEFAERLGEAEAAALLDAVAREVDYDGSGEFDGHIVWSTETCHLVEPRARGGAVLPILQAPDGAREEAWCGRLHRLLRGLPALPPPDGGWPAGAVTEVPALLGFVGRTIPTRREG